MPSPPSRNTIQMRKLRMEHERESRRLDLEERGVRDVERRLLDGKPPMERGEFLAQLDARLRSPYVAATTWAALGRIKAGVEGWTRPDGEGAPCGNDATAPEPDREGNNRVAGPAIDLAPLSADDALAILGSVARGRDSRPGDRVSAIRTLLEAQGKLRGGMAADGDDDSCGDAYHALVVDPIERQGREAVLALLSVELDGGRSPGISRDAALALIDRQLKDADRADDERSSLEALRRMVSAKADWKPRLDFDEGESLADRVWRRARTVRSGGDAGMPETDPSAPRFDP